MHQPNGWIAAITAADLPPQRSWALPVPLRRIGLALLAAAGVTGCATYAPAPLGEGKGASDVAALNVPAALMPTRKLAAHRFDPAGGLDVTETAMLAVVNSPDLKVKRDELGIARAQAFAAGLLPDPQLSVGQDFPTSSGSGLTRAFMLGLNYDIDTLLTRSSRRAAATGEREQVNLGLLWAEWQTIAQARLLFGQVLAARAQERELRAEDVALAPVDHQVHAALAAGNLTYDSASAGLNAATDVRRRLAETIRQRRQAEHDLHLLLGLAPQVVLQLQGAPYQTAPTAADVAAALASLPRRRPDLLALQAGYHAQEARLRGAILAQFPALTVGFIRARDTSAVYTSGFTIGLTVPLFDRNRGNIAIETATRQRLKDDYAARLLTARSDVQQLLADLATLQQQRAELTTHAQQLDAVRRAAERAWHGGLLDWPTYLAIRGNALAADLDLISVRLEQAKQAVTLETLLGYPDFTPTASAKTPAL